MSAVKSGIFFTSARKEREKRNRKLVKDYQQLTSAPGAMKTAVVEQLMKKYKIGSRQTVYSVLKNKR